GRAGERHNLTGGVSPELRRVNAVEKAGRIWVFAHVQKVLHNVPVEMIAEVVKVLDVRIIRVGRVGVAAADFVAANVVNSFLGGPVLSDLPGKELIERVPAQARAREQIGANTSRFRKSLRLVGRS